MLFSGKTYFFKGKGYWQFDDYRMRVAHEHQRKSAQKWMNCRETLEVDPNNRQYLKNPKRDEEIDDTIDDEEDMYFEEFETSTKISIGNRMHNKEATLLILAFFMQYRGIYYNLIF